jgi:hypothetical protein
MPSFEQNDQTIIAQYRTEFTCARLHIYINRGTARTLVCGRMIARFHSSEICVSDHKPRKKMALFPFDTNSVSIHFTSRFRLSSRLLPNLRSSYIFKS